MEGLIAFAGKFLRPGRANEQKRIAHPELFLELIDAFEALRPALVLHADGWPEPEHLRSVVKRGQPGNGIADVGAGKTREDAGQIPDVLDRSDRRPVWVVVNAGSSTLARAPHALKAERPAREPRNAVAKLRILENGAQANSAARPLGLRIHLIPTVRACRPQLRLTDCRRTALEVAAQEPWQFSRRGRDSRRPDLLHPLRRWRLGAHQLVMEPSGRRYSVIGRSCSVNSATRSALRGSNSTPSPGLSVGYSLPARKE